MQDRGSELILVVAPVPKEWQPIITNYAEVTTKIKDLAAGHGVRFYDFNEATTLNSRTDFKDFHHLNGEEKDYAMASLRMYSEKTMMKEVEKCAVLCSNCHRKLHAGLISDIWRKNNEKSHILDICIHLFINLSIRNPDTGYW